MIATVPEAVDAAGTAPNPGDAVRDGTARSSADVAGVSPGSEGVSKSASAERAVEAAAEDHKAAAEDAETTAVETDGLSFGQ